MKKIIGLLVLILTPVFIILFLNFFGENKYKLPVFYENDIPESIEGCPIDIPHQVSIPDRIKNGFPGYLFADNTRIDELQEIQSLSEELNKFVQCVILEENKELNDVWVVLASNVENFRKCELLIPGYDSENNTLPLVLVDNRGRIRGYYNGLFREEVSRLMTEIKILADEDKSE